MNDALFSLQGRFYIKATSLKKADSLAKHTKYFLMAFQAYNKPMCKSNTLYNLDGSFVYQHIVAFKFVSDYQTCDTFRSALCSFSLVKHLSFDGLDICACHDNE